MGSLLLRNTNQDMQLAAAEDMNVPLVAGVLPDKAYEGSGGR